MRGGTPRPGPNVRPDLHFDRSDAESEESAANDGRTVERALEGRPEAVAELVDRLTPVLQARVARRLLAHGGSSGRNVRQEVEDLVQEVFLLLFAADGRVLRQWQPERGLSLENFVGLVAERQTISILRTGKRNPWKEDPTPPEDLHGQAPGPTPEEAAASRQILAGVLDRLRESLSPLGWQLFDWIYLQELSVAEVRRVSGLSQDAVYAWRSRLRKAARTLLAEVMSETGA